MGVVQVIAVVLITTVIRWESHNPQVFSKYGGIVLTGWLIGLVVGDPKLGLAVGGLLELMQIGLVGMTGSSVPDYMVACAVATSLTGASGYGVDGAIALAVPVAALSVNFDVLVKTLNIAPFHHIAALVERERYDAAFRWAAWGSLSRTLVSTTIPVLGYLLLGNVVAGYIFDLVPGWVLEGFGIAGDMLPALGMCMLLRTIGRERWFYLVIGIAFASWFGLPLAAVSIVGFILALIIVYPKVRQIEPITFEGTTQDQDSVLRRSDLRRVFIRYLLAIQSFFNYENHIGCGVMYATGPARQKIYAGHPNLLKESVRDSLMFYNSQAYVGAPLLVASLALEEASPTSEGRRSASLLRTSLMGPIGAVGDSLFNHVLKASLAGIAATGARQGSLSGIWVCMLAGLVIFVFRWILFTAGYRWGMAPLLGRKAVVDVILDGLEVFGAVVIGALIVLNVSISGLVSIDTSVGVPGSVLCDGAAVALVLVLYVLMMNKRHPVPMPAMVWIIIAIAMMISCMGMS